MNSSEINNNFEEQGQAIAQSLEDLRIQKEKNMAKADKRKVTMIKRAAEENF